MPVPKVVKSYLSEHKVPYDVIHHHRDFTAQKTAADTHTPGRDFAKTVVLYVDRSYCMVVLPAIAKVDLEKIKKELGAKEIGFATEDEIANLCTNCEVGAMPPFGGLYNMPVYVSHHLVDDHIITFNAGTHEHVIRLEYTDFEELVAPMVLDLTKNWA